MILKFSMEPWEEDGHEKKYPLVGWLEEHTGLKIEAVPSKDYQQQAEALARGEVHLASLGGGAFVAAEKINPEIDILAVDLYWNDDATKGLESYQSYILTLKKYEDIQTLKDLQGKTFGFVDEESTSGFLVPRLVLQEHGIDYQTWFEQVFFLGSHERVIEALAAGSIDAGAVYDDMLKHGAADHGDIFKLLIESDPIPNACIAVHPSVPDDIRKKLQDALLQGVDPEVLEAMELAGYTLKPKSYYDIIRKIAAEE